MLKIVVGGFTLALSRALLVGKGGDRDNRAVVLERHKRVANAEAQRTFANTEALTVVKTVNGTLLAGPRVGAILTAVASQISLDGIGCRWHVCHEIIGVWVPWLKAQPLLE